MKRIEHYKSTGAATAIIILSLVVASHVLYPRDPSEQVPRGGPAAVAESASTWIDPPAQAVSGLASRTTVAPNAQGRAETPRAASFTLLPVPALPREAALQLERLRKVEPVRRKKFVQSGLRSHQSATAGGAITAPRNTEVEAAKFDPIGDLLRGLGIGRNGEG